MAAAASVSSPPAWHGRRSAALGFALALLVLAAAPHAARAALRYDPDSDAEGGSLMTPTRGELLSRRFYYEIPHDPVGVLFMAHGCVHDAADFWPPSKACPECSGLPEEVSHTKQALARGYAVLAVDSRNRDFDNRCYSYETDKWGVKYILENWTREQGLQALPVFALGVSAGASFCLKLPKITRINGVISEVLGVAQESFATPDMLGDTYPPAVFIDMQRDTSMTQRISQSVDILHAHNVPATTIPVDPRPVTHSFFSDRSQYISPELSREIVNGLRKIGMIDYQGYVTTDPRYTTQPWKEQLMEILPHMRPETGNPDGLASDPAIIGEQMNLAWASHEIISDYLTPCLAWLEAGGQKPIDGFLRALQIRSPLAKLNPDRQAQPRLQDDEALKEAAKQVEQQLAVTTGKHDNWGDMYAAYVDWLATNPSGDITFPAWRASHAAGRFQYTQEDAATDPIAAAALAKAAAAEAAALQAAARRAAIAARRGLAGPGGLAAAVAAQVAADQATAKAKALQALANGQDVPGATGVASSGDL
ncbi:hypothetical protein ABPG77_001981 [Micractinium sp. CCAP 211/92]